MDCGGTGRIYEIPFVLIIVGVINRSKLKLIAFLDACTSVLSYFPLKKGSYFGFLTIFMSLVLPDAPIFLHERWWGRCYACN